MSSLYKFRVSLEDDENIYRDIEIQASQTFEALIPCIYKSFTQKKNSKSSIFSATESWRRGKQYKDLTRTLSSEVDNPHQKMIFEVENTLFGSYQIELIKISSDYDLTLQYPLCIKSVGLLPNQASDEDEDEFTTEAVVDEEEDLDGLTQYDDLNTWSLRRIHEKTIDCNPGPDGHR